MVGRTHRNWLARMAFASISSVRGYRTIMLPGEVRWECCKVVMARKDSRDSSWQTGKLVLVC